MVNVLELHCVSEPCLNGGTCHELVSADNFQCSCIPPYAGQRCQGIRNGSTGLLYDWRVHV